MDDDFEKQLEFERQEKLKQTEQQSTGSDPYKYIDPNDGTEYEWDSIKQAWFAKLDDNILLAYQSQYGYAEEKTNSTTSSTTTTTITMASGNAEGSTLDEKNQSDASDRGKAEKRKANNEPSWFEVDETHNTNVYVSGLPSDITEEEFNSLMSKCGLIMKDPDTNKFKIKLYKNEDGSLKGDGRCCYIRVESVELALNILDGYLVKNKPIHVERAQFQLKGNYDPSKKPRKKKQKEKEKIKKRFEKLLDWRPEKMRGQRTRNEKTVVIKNMFDCKEFEHSPAAILEYQDTLREECARFGEVKKVVVYDRHPEGVATVTFLEPEMADECIALMNNRWYAKRQLSAETWDGRTKYRVFETEEQLEKRLQDWDKYLNEDEGGEKKAASSNHETSTSSELKKINAQTEYERAGETESSGDSDVEQVQECKNDN